MFKIRTLRPNDLAKIKELCNDNEITAPLENNSFLCFLQPLVPHNLRNFPSIHLAVEDRNILGFIMLRCASKPNNAWRIDHVFVPDDIRNEGIGEELVKYTLSVYGSYGVEHFLAKVDPRNHAAVSLFHSCGFRRYAKVYFYEKELDTNSEAEENILSSDKDFIIRPQTINDLTELEKLELSSIPPDLRHALGRAKEYFKQKKNSYLLIHKPRNILIGWFNMEEISNDHFSIELLVSPGWTHLYEQLLNTVIYDYIANKNRKIRITVKVVDYLTELTQILNRLGFLASEVRELLVRTIWQRVKEKKKKAAQIGLPYTAPT